jgi:hypothetical protein
LAVVICLQFRSDFRSRKDQPSVHGIALGNPVEGRVCQKVITNTDLFRGALEPAAKLDKRRSLLPGGAKYTSVGTASSRGLEDRGIGGLIANRTKRFFFSIVSGLVPLLCHLLVYWVRVLESNECVKLTPSSSVECKNEWSFLHCPHALKVSSGRGH